MNINLRLTIILGVTHKPRSYKGGGGAKSNLPYGLDFLELKMGIFPNTEKFSLLDCVKTSVNKGLTFFCIKATQYPVSTHASL